MEDSDHTGRTVSRRDALKSISAGAFLGTGIVATAAGEDTVEITVARDREGPVQRKPVPKAWYNHHQHSRDVARRMRRQFAGERGVEAVARVKDEQRYGGKPGFRVRVEVDRDEYHRAIPQAAGGVPIEVTEPREKGFGACQGTHTSVDPVPGGAVFEEERGSSCGGFGSTFMTVFDSTANVKRLLTAGHIFEACSNDIVGMKAEQGGDDFGVVDRYDAKTDWATITPENKSIPDPAVIREDDGTELEVHAWKNEDGIADLVASDETVYQTGTTTGTTSGTVEGDNYEWGFDCVDFGGSGVQCKIPNAEGDSGGPVYTRYTEERAHAISMYQMWINSNGSRTCDPEGPCTSSDCIEGEYLQGVAFNHLWDNFRIGLP